MSFSAAARPLALLAFHQPVLLRAEIPIEETDTTPTLSEKLSRTGAGLMVQTVGLAASGKLKPEAQDHSAATKAALLKKPGELAGQNQLRQFYRESVQPFLAKRQRGRTPLITSTGAALMFDIIRVELHPDLHETLTAALAREVAHDTLDGERVLAQRVGLVELAEDGPGLVSCGLHARENARWTCPKPAAILRN